MNYYLDVLKKYMDFSGRARRAEYWMFALFNVIAIVLLLIVDGAAKTTGVLTIIYVLATLIPSLAVTVRRLHDTDRSGWWYLISLIPFGGIVLFVFLVQDSQPGQNRYGPSPKGEEASYAGPTTQAPRRDIAGELERLAALRDRGALTEDEFNTRKQALLQ